MGRIQRGGEVNQETKARMRGEQMRVLENIAVQTSEPKDAWWLSFADDDGFRGAVIVHAGEFLEAVMRANLRGINPHGECQGMPIPADVAAQIPDKWKNRILSRNECAAFDAEMLEGEK